MENEYRTVILGDLALPGEIGRMIRSSRGRDVSGWSGDKTYYLPEDGLYLKIAGAGNLCRAARMQEYLAEHGFSSRVLAYDSAERDVLLMEPVAGESGIAPRYLSDPARLSTVFGESLRQLHDLDAAECPYPRRLDDLIGQWDTASFDGDHLALLSPWIGGSDPLRAGREIADRAGILVQDTVIHGDYCLPNIMLRDWSLAGFVDVSEGGVGDRHYDLAWGLWTLAFNTGSAACGDRFLDAYGRDAVDGDRLRLCGLLAGME